VSRALDVADHSYTEAARRGLGTGASKKEMLSKGTDGQFQVHNNSGIMAGQPSACSTRGGHDQHQRLPHQKNHHQQKSALARSIRPAAPGTSASNPRSAVAQFFLALQTLMHTQKVPAVVKTYN
jgi:hypothetical protein